MKKNIWLSNKEYDKIYSRVPRACVDLVIKSPKGILFCKRKIQPYKGSWHLPGGRVMFRESINKAIARIALKEVGLQIKVKKLLGYMEFLKEVQNNSPRHTISFVFLAELVSGQPKNDENSEVVMFFKEMPKAVLPIHGKFLRENSII